MQTATPPPTDDVYIRDPETGEWFLVQCATCSYAARVLQQEKQPVQRACVLGVRCPFRRRVDGEASSPLQETHRCNG